MEKTNFEKLSARISDELGGRAKDLNRTVEDVVRNFRNLGLGTAVWYPEKIHVTNVGGIDAESYIGYSRVEGKWGLQVRTIERDRETGAFVGQRVYNIESCRNVEIVINALRKIRELASYVAQTADRQIKLLEGTGGEFDELRKPECGIS